MLNVCDACVSGNTTTDLELSFLLVFFHLFQVVIEGTAAGVQLVAVLQDVSLLHTQALTHSTTARFSLTLYCILYQI